jgi:hypothetical protein
MLYTYSIEKMCESQAALVKLKKVDWVGRSLAGEESWAMLFIQLPCQPNLSIKICL